MMKKYFAPAVVVVSIFLFTAARVEAQGPPNPCCAIVAVDAATGVATAKITADGRVFQFKPKNPAITTLQLGQPVYANFAKSQVSVDGRTVCCVMTSGPQFVAPPIGAATLAGEPAVISAAANNNTACCVVTGIDYRSGIISGRDEKTGYTFKFIVKFLSWQDSTSAFSNAAIGQKIWADFRHRDVKMEYQKICCSIIEESDH